MVNKEKFEPRIAHVYSEHLVWMLNRLLAYVRKYPIIQEKKVITEDTVQRFIQYNSEFIAGTLPIADINVTDRNIADLYDRVRFLLDYEISPLLRDQRS